MFSGLTLIFWENCLRNCRDRWTVTFEIHLHIYCQKIKYRFIKTTVMRVKIILFYIFRYTTIFDGIRIQPNSDGSSEFYLLYPFTRYTRGLVYYFSTTNTIMCTSSQLEIAMKVRLGLIFINSEVYKPLIN